VGSFDPGIINWRPGKFLFYFNDAISQEEHKQTIYRGLTLILVTWAGKKLPNV
jgi:hypothetical protein